MHNRTYMTDELLLLADSGSTKTDWCIVENDKQLLRCYTQGINPFHQNFSVMEKIITDEFLPQIGILVSRISKIRFYGAGCRPQAAENLVLLLNRFFPKACGSITVASDIDAAAIAVCGNQEGIACILGTGSNSCLWNGTKVVANIPPMGYVLGDEGSGAVLGRLFLNALFKGSLSKDLRNEFLSVSGQTLEDIIRRTYREPLPNRYLASFSPFIKEHVECPGVRSLVVDNFKDFFNKNVCRYERLDLPLGAVGSIAFYFREELEEAAAMCKLRIRNVVKTPMEGMLLHL